MTGDPGEMLATTKDVALRNLRANAADLADIVDSHQLMKGRAPRPPGGHTWFGLTLAGLLAVAVPFLLLDGPIALGLRRVGGDPTGFFRAITDLGLAVWYVTPAAVIVAAAMLSAPLQVIDRASARLAVFLGRVAYLLVSVGGISLAIGIVKRGVGRARPKLIESVGPFDFSPMSFDGAYASFPSGHSTTIGALAVVVALLVPRLRLPAFAVAILVALSRVMVGAHYPSDVISGFLVGAAGAWLIAAWLARRRLVFEVAPDGTIRTRGGRLLGRPPAVGAAFAELARRFTKSLGQGARG